ncbi:xylitol dehydrogenase [Suhomyces tanzawaensis NRRL Y-17324]|uniref:Xylitol dehydrogenase n=1 Tax=Suhomyces tanzawaensis NRRL Y-17324 TaxID=984487 RepID=A0A1E4SJF0_9ASCO|nr:xylitol dehydrogenase [Suhomyces tanzawaensis NRRL Y-17324]ODV79562.1 xylitol dehydrogenase [Suhomyces tanzawaensis NRRL Y-17324]
MTPNPSLVLNKIDDISFETYDAPEISQPTDVIVEVKKTGICGSDIHYYAHGKIGKFVLTKPMVLGHESSGIVSKIGPGVTSLKVGDKVAIEPGVPSRYSDEYKSGHYNLCPHMCFAATPSASGDNPPGTLCKYYKSPEDFLVKLPDHVSLDMGALVEPTSVGVHAAKLANLKFGDYVAVFGAGPVGLLAASVAKLFGAAGVIVVDIFDTKLELAKSIGAATHVFNSKTGGAEELIQAFDGHSPSVILECTGAEVCIGLGVEIAAPGARFVQVGNAGSAVKFPITEFATKEMTLFGSFRYGFNDYKTAVKIFDENYKNGNDNAPIDFEQLITHRFKFDDAIKAYDLVRAGTGSVKCIIDGPE